MKKNMTIKARVTQWLLQDLGIENSLQMCEVYGIVKNITSL
jgi:hypothetical protein